MKDRLKGIFDGYNSVDLSEIPVQEINSAWWVDEQGEKWCPKEYAFFFPYYIDYEDQFKIGVAMADLKMIRCQNVATNLEFRGEERHVDVLFTLRQTFLINKEIAVKKCKLILERSPIEVGKSSKIGEAFVYERFGVVPRKEKE